MSLLTRACARLLLLLPIYLGSSDVFAQGSLSSQGGEYAVAGYIGGDQVHPNIAINPAGGYVVWQDNLTDGDGWGIAAQALNSTLSGTYATFRVNEQGAGQQENPRVGLLNNGGAVFVWQGGQPGFQKIYARFLSAAGTFATGDVMVNNYTNQQQINPALAILNDGTVVATWQSFGQDGSMFGVFGQRLSATGAKLGSEFRVNQTTAYNQRTPNVASLADGNFVVTWVSETFRGSDTSGGEVYAVEIWARVYSRAGVALGNEFKVNSSANVCANPVVSGAGTGGFAVIWSQLDGLVDTNSWDVFGRIFDAGGAPVAAEFRVNTFTYGDQFAPMIASVGSSYLVTWTSMGQDGSREGVYAQALTSAGGLDGGEFRVNSTTFNQQLHPTVAADGESRFLVLWSSYISGTQFDLFAQRYGTSANLPTLATPSIAALSGSRLAISWAELQGFNVANYSLYVDGSVVPISLTNNYYIFTGLATSSTHSFRLEYTLASGQRSSPSGTVNGKTWGEDANYDGLPDDWQARYWGADPTKWPGPNEDSDGDGATNLQEFLAGTDPTDAQSVLRMNIANTDQGLWLNWNSQPGVVYQVQTSGDAKSWINLGKPRFAAGATDSISLTSAGDMVMFRIVRVR